MLFILQKELHGSYKNPQEPIAQIFFYKSVFIKRPYIVFWYYAFLICDLLKTYVYTNIAIALVIDEYKYA